jgi:hypothetical protein
MWFVIFEFLDWELWHDLWRCYTLCHAMLCTTSWFYFPCLFNLNWAGFLHENTCECWEYMWIFLEFLSAFPIWLRFSPLFGHLLIFCETCLYLICEILVINWMDVKFGMSIVDILTFAMILVPFIYHVWLLFYDWLKWMHVLMPWMSLLEFVLTFWISLTCFPWCKWAEIWYDWHVMNDGWSWNFWGFIEMFWYWFDCDHSVWSFEVLNCMFCTLFLMKW